MPYKDPEKRRAVWRESQARKRGSTPRQPLAELQGLRFSTARDVLTVLSDELAEVKRKMQAGTPERARVVALLCGSLIRAFEQVDVLNRLEALEEELKVFRDEAA